MIVVKFLYSLKFILIEELKQFNASRSRRINHLAGSVQEVRDQAQMLIFESPVVFKTVQMRSISIPLKNRKRFKCEQFKACRAPCRERTRGT